MSPRPSRPARLHAWLMQRLIPSIGPSDALDAAYAFDGLRRDAWRLSLWSGIVFWCRETRSLVTTAVRERVPGRAGQPAGPDAPRPPRSARGGLGFDRLLSHLKYGARQLVRTPGVSAIAIGSMALGIASVVFVFAVIHGILWRPLPVADPGTLVRLEFADDATVWSYPDYADVAAAMPALSGAVAYSSDEVTIALPGGGPRRVRAETASRNLFDVLAVPTMLGRGFVPGDPDDVVVIGSRLWQVDFDRAADVIGRQIDVRGRPHAIIGVAAEGLPSLEGPIEPSLWLPVDDADRQQRGSRFLRVVGRLADGQTIARAQAQADAAAAGLIAAHPDLHRPRGGRELRIGVVDEIGGRLSGGDRSAGLAVIGAVFALALMVLGLSASNVANLQMGRAAERRDEIGVRLAMGARRGQIVTQLLIESTLLAVVAGAVAVAVVKIALVVLATLVARTSPATLALGVDPIAAGVAAAVSLGSVLAFGLVPALQSARLDLMSVLRGRQTAGRGTGILMRRIIVGVQVTGAVVLMVVALTFARSFAHTRQIALGFDPSGVAIVRVDLSQGRYADAAATSFFDRATERLRQDPATQAVAWARTVPLSGSSMATSVRSIEGYTPAEGEPLRFGTNTVSAGYFGLVGIPILRGREFTAEDRPGAPAVAIVNEAFARRYWPDGQVLGRRLDDATVIGVAGNLHSVAIGDADRPYAWYAAAQHPQILLTAHVLTSDDPAAAGVRLARALGDLDPTLIFEGGAMAAASDAALILPRTMSIGLSTTGGVALVMAMIGVYGVFAFLVRQRTREFGVRMALGAAPGVLLRQTLTQALRLVAPGTAIGIALGIAVTLALRSQLVGVGAIDPVVIGVATAGIVVATVTATFVPARRAARIDPIASLRQD